MLLLYYIFGLSFIAIKPCQDSTVSVSYVDGLYNNNVYTVYYTARYCHSNTYSYICRDGLDNDEATTICQQQGYTCNNYKRHASLPYYSNIIAWPELYWA